MKFIWRCLVISLSVFVAANLPMLGIHYDTIGALVTASLLLGIANSLVRPILLLIALPLVLLTFGLFVLVINAFLFYSVGWLVTGFHVPSFWSALGGSLIVSVIGMLLGMNKRPAYTTYRTQARRTPPPGKGPIIDI